MSSSGAPSADWQIACRNLQHRGDYLLKSGLWSDCKFIIGMEPNQQTIECHKLLLAMASPVFQAMFFGGIAEKRPIAILDVQPEAFRALLEYIYTDRINLASFDQACELCYAAKKYMLPHLVEECMRYLWADLKPRNACRAYEFAKLFEEPKLMEKCLLIIRNETEEVLNDPSFEDIEIGTFLTILDQEYLCVPSELALFYALARYAGKQQQHQLLQTSNSGSAISTVSAAADVVSTPSTSTATCSTSPSIRDCLAKIRFLTLTPQQFADGPGGSNLLTQAEKFELLMNISSSHAKHAMPAGFSRNVLQRKFAHDPVVGGNAPVVEDDFSHTTNNKAICLLKLLHSVVYDNTGMLESTMSFAADRNICVYGIQVQAQVRGVGVSSHEVAYTELLYTYLQDADGARLTYTHFTSRALYDSAIVIFFNRPIFIQKNKTYRIGVTLNKIGCYRLSTYERHCIANGVRFTFSEKSEVVRAIIFSCSTTNNTVNDGSGGDFWVP